MSNAVYPSLVQGLTYTVLRTPEFATIVQKAPNGTEVRIPQMQNPIWHFTLLYDFLFGHFNNPNNTMAYAPCTDIDTLVGFFLARQGQNDDFLWTDPKNNSIGPAVSDSSPNLQAQLQLVNDGVGNYYSPIQRKVGGLFWEDITDLNGTVTVYANGSLQTSGTNYTVAGPGLAIPGSSFLGMYLKWTSPAAWIASRSYALNATILDPAGHIQKVTTAGTSGSTQPAWNANIGNTTTDGSVTWTNQGL